MSDALRATAQRDPMEPNKTGAGLPASGDAEEPEGAPESEDDPAELLATRSKQLKECTDNLMTHQCAFLNEQVSVTGMKQQFEGCPLALVKPSSESGNVMVVIDCNCWGETDVQARKRACPIGKDKLDVVMRGLTSARYGTDEPEALQHGEIWCMLTGGKDRKRAFKKNVVNHKMKAGRANRNRIVVKQMMPPCTQVWGYRSGGICG